MEDAMTRKRQVLVVPGVPRHHAPIPTAVKVGGLLFSSAVGGKDPETGTTPPEPERQIWHLGICTGSWRPRAEPSMTLPG